MPYRALSLLTMILWTGSVTPGLHAATYEWTAGGDGVSLYQEANWTILGGSSTIPTINGGTPVNHDLVVDSGTPGGSGGAGGTLDLGTGSLTVNGGTVRMNVISGYGIQNGPLTQTDGTVIAQFLGNLAAGLSGGTLELNGANNPLNGATLQFTAASTATVHFINESPADVQSEHLSKITVDGQAAVVGVNLKVDSDGAAGSLVSRQVAFIDTDMDQMDDNWEIYYFGDLSRDGTLDFDGDGLNDLGEYEAGTDPTDTDSDGDVLRDGAETGTGNYVSPDNAGTDPTDTDSDDDGTPDGLEIERGLDPTDAGSRLDRPNVIFILCDDLGYGDLGVLFQATKSGKKHFTPHLDTVASEGTILNQHYCPAPVCAPSRSSLLLGVHQGHANVRDNQFDKALTDNHTLASTLQQAGYTTALIGKYGLQGSGGSPAAWPAYPTKRGFDYFFGYVRHADGHTHYPAHVTDSRGTKELYDQEQMIRDDLDYCYTADLFTARAKKLIVDQTANQPDQPFFLFLSFDTPHAALQLPTMAYPAGGGLTGGLQWQGTPGSMINTASGTIDSFRHPDYTTAVGNSWTDVEERFATSVRRIDDCVGDLVQTLKDLSIDDNTLVVFSSDNGPHSEDYLSTGDTNDGSSYLPTSFDSYGPFEGIKRDTWEGGVRMPTLVRWPGMVTANVTNSTPSQFQDWLPTFGELAGWTNPSRTDGVSLMPLLTGTGTRRDGTVYIEYNVGGSTPNYGDFSNHGGAARNQMQVIHLEGYKGIRNNIGSHADDFRIYDITTDLSEGTNLAGSSTYFNGLQQRMKDAVLRVRQPDSSAARPYDAALVPPVTVYVEPGLSYRTYQGYWPWLPEFRDLAPVSTGQTATVDLTLLPQPDHAGLLFTGFVQIPADGVWTFSLTSDAGASLRIHESQVVDDDFGHDGSEATGDILLKAGLHPIRLYYRTAEETAALNFQYEGPGTVKQPVPTSALFRDTVAPPEPQPQPDSAFTPQNTPVLIDVLANDLDDGLPGPLTIHTVGQPAGGTAVKQGGEVLYTPTASFLGTDTFPYVVTDGQYFATSSVTVEVIYQASDIWLPLNETSGGSVFEVGGALAGTMGGFADANTARIDGKFGKALAFDGLDDQVDLPGLPPLPTGDTPRTIMAWIRIQPGTAFENQTIFGYGANNNGQRFTFRTNGSGGSPSGQELRLEVQSGSIVGTRILDDGQWHHVAVAVDDFDSSGTMDVAEARLYVDGQPDPASTSAPRDMNTASGTLPRLGGSNHGDGYNFAGDIDELRLVDRVLGATEILAVYNADHQASEAWHRRYFGPASVTWTPDDDGDGVIRLGEYAFGGQPWISDALVMILDGTYHHTTDRLNVMYNRRVPGSHELIYTGQATDDMADWESLLVTEKGSVPHPFLEGFDQVTIETAENGETEFHQGVRVKAAFQP